MNLIKPTKQKKIYNPKLLREITREKVKRNAGQLDKEIAEKSLIIITLPTK